MRKYRFTILFAALLVLWLVFGQSLMNEIARRLVQLDNLPPVSGRLFYTQGFNGIWRFDLENGAMIQWWLPPEGGMVTGIAASPDGSTLAIAYAPPAEEGFQIGTTDIYLTSAETPDPQSLLVRADRSESFRNPAWSPDGETLLYTHVRPNRNEAGETVGVSLRVEQVRISETSEPETLIERAEQAVISPDGRQVAFLKFDPVSYGKALWVMDRDGSNARELLPARSFFDLASLRFAADGESLFFSGSGDYQAALMDDTDRLAWAGLSIARAHGLPWNIWEIGLDDQTMTKLTATTLDGPWLAWSPDHDDMAVLAAEGIFIWYEASFYRVKVVTSEGEITWVR